MACALTQSYILDCQNFFGGVKTVYLIEFSNISAAPTIVAGSVTVLPKVTAKFWRKYQIEAHTAEGDEAGAVTKEAGTRAVKQSIKFPINGMTASVNNEIELLAQNRLMIILEDNNGAFKLYGKDFGMRLNSYSAKTGAKLNDRSGYELAFEGEEKFIAPFVGDTVAAALETPGA